MNDVLDVALHDDDLHTEIRLVAELMVAAAESPTSLSEEHVDAILLGRRG